MLLCRSAFRVLCVLIMKSVCISLIMRPVDSGATATQSNDQKIIAKVEIHGNVHFSHRDILEVLSVRPGGHLPPEWPDKSIEHLLSGYYKQGYFSANVDSIWERVSQDSQFVELAIWISEGQPVRVGQIEIQGPESVRQRDLVRIIETSPDGIFYETLLQQDIEHILEYYENRGYPLSRVNIRSLSMELEKQTTKMNIVLEVEPGPVVTIDSIHVEGNDLTKEQVVLRETRLEMGSLYRHKDVVSVRERLQRQGYFLEVADPIVVFVQDKANITLRVKEGNSSTIDGVVGYNPSKREGVSGYFTGRLQFAFRNLLGTGRFLEAYWEKKDETSQAMRFGYEEPWLMGWPLHLGGQFQQEIRDTTYVEREWYFSIRYVPWNVLSINMSGGQKEVLPDSLGSLQYALPQTKSWFLSIGIDYNTLDNPLNPRKGIRYHTSLHIGRKRNLGPDFLMESGDWKGIVNTRRLQVDAEMILPIFRRQVTYIGLHGTEVKTGDRFVPLSDQIRFGGTRTLRGYAEDAFRGTLVAWLNTEYRYLIGRHSRAFVFLDCGIYQRHEAQSGRIEGVKIGYGFGIRLETRLGLMGIDYGLGEGDRFMQGKIHIGLVNWF